MLMGTTLVFHPYLICPVSARVVFGVSIDSSPQGGKFIYPTYLRLGGGFFGAQVDLRGDRYALRYREKYSHGYRRRRLSPNSIAFSLISKNGRCAFSSRILLDYSDIM